EGDCAMFGEAQAHDRGTFDLRLDPLRIDVGTAIYRGIDPGHNELALVVDGYLDDRRDIADEAAMRGNAKPVTLGNVPSPAALVCYQFDHLADPSGVDRIAVIGLAVAPQVLYPGEVEDPRCATQLKQHIFLITIGAMAYFT